ncbi:MAG: anthranilate phosphoribosyltransferase [Fimbriimonas sp.]
MTYAELLDPLLARRDMTFEHAQEVMRYLMGGEATDAQIGGVLIALRVKGCITRELAAFASVLRSQALTIRHDIPNLVDTCGTGGGAPSFNISTAAAIVSSAAGAKIAKHGNRAVTSSCGSADVLEALGVPLSGDPEHLLKVLGDIGIVFLFAPAHHPAMRHVGKARRELGVRTVFNQLGPLANPAGATRQLIGVFDAGLMRSMGEALRELGCERALLVHGDDGLDELSPCGRSEVVQVKDGRVSTTTVEPADFGLTPIDPIHLQPGETIADNAVILKEAISDPNSPRASAILPSVAAALWLGGVADDFRLGAEMGRAAIASGAALGKLDALIASGGDSQ